MKIKKSLTHIDSLEEFLDLPKDVRQKVKHINFRGEDVENLQSDTFEGCTKIHYILLNRSNATSIPEGLLEDCEVLRGISTYEVAFDSMPNEFIRKRRPRFGCLSIKGSNITEIPEVAYSNFPDIMTIALQDSKLESLPKNLLQSLRNLRAVEFENNRLSEIPKDLLDGTKVYSANFDGNPLVGLKPTRLKHNITLLAYADPYVLCLSEFQGTKYFTTRAVTSEGVESTWQRYSSDVRYSGFLEDKRVGEVFVEAVEEYFGKDTFYKNTIPG